MKTYLSLLTLATIGTCTSLTGCATNSELAKVQTEAHEARQTADQALSIAQDANRRSEHTEQMLDRSFKHSMRK